MLKIERIKEIKGYIYKIENTVNNKVYIGQTINIKSRLSDHKTVVHSCTDFDNDREIYGWEKFSKIILHEIEFDTPIVLRYQLNVLEKEEIKKYNSVAPNGYNCTLGGAGSELEITEETRDLLRKNMKNLWEDEDYRKRQISSHLGNIPSEETRKKMSESHKEYIKEHGIHPNCIEAIKNRKVIISDEQRVKISNSLKEYFSKNEISEETREKISKAHKGKKHSKEWNDKISNAHKGRIMPQDVREKIRKTKKEQYDPENSNLIKYEKGHIPWTAGKKMPKEHCEILSLAHQKRQRPVVQYDTNGNELNIFPNQYIASKELGCRSEQIFNCCVGKMKTTGGFIFKFFNYALC